MRAKFKRWAEPFLKENNEFCCFEEDIQTSKSFSDFIKRDKLNLEIGPGKGKFIIDMAKKYPELNFIGVEKNMSIAGTCAKLCKQENLNNVYIISADVFKVFEFLPNHSLENVFLNHSDPWPKKRHEKRRLTYKTFLEEYKKVLQNQGILIFKTDNKDMFDFSLESIKENGWDIFDLTYDYDGKDDFDALTNYEENFRNLNQPIYRLKAKMSKGDN